MSKIISIFKFALQYFYPTKHHEIDGVQYKSKKEMYREWFNSNYINGSWYIAEEIDPIVATIERSIEDIFYMIETEYRYYLGFRTNHFTGSQVVKVNIKTSVDNVETEYNYNAKLLENDKNYVYLPLDEEISPSNIVFFSLEADSIVENHIEYTSIPKISVTSPQSKLVVITKEEYDRVRKNDIILQKPHDTIQIMRYTQEHNNRTAYGLKMRNTRPLYYDSNQYIEYEVNINSTRGSKPISDTVGTCCFSEAMTEAEVIITVSPYQKYSGYKVKLEYDEINGRSYTNPHSIEYIVE